MSRLAHQAYSNSNSAKLAANSSAIDETPDLRVLDLGQAESTPDIQLRPEPEHLEELARLRSENAALRSQLEQNEQLMQAAMSSEETWLERQKEFELLLEEKSDVIRDLHHKIHELQEGSAGQNLTRAEELNQFKKDLDDRQSQLVEDEKSLLSQMRAMEMSLSRDRAELARQRNDLQRLRDEVNREIELASRDSGLRDRLASLSRRANEEPRRSTAPKTQMCIELPPLPDEIPAKPAAAPPASSSSPLATPKIRSFVRWLFGG